MSDSFSSLYLTLLHDSQVKLTSSNFNIFVIQYGGQYISISDLLG